MQPATEKILLEQAREGQEQAFAQLVEAHSEKLLGLAWRLVGRRDEAEEIVQEAFLRLFRTLPSFRGDSRLGTWLFRTVSRLAIDHLRREQLKRRIFFFRSGAPEQADPMDLAADPAASPQDRLLARETAERLMRTLNRLPPQQKAVFVLRHQEERPLKEIAATLGLEEGTVKTHLHRAVGRLRQEFREGKEKSP